MVQSPFFVASLVPELLFLLENSQREQTIDLTTVWTGLANLDDTT